MGSTTLNSPRTTLRTGAARRRSVVALATAILFTSLFVDVGVARAEYPVGWEDPDLMSIGACIGYCGSAFISKGKLAKYGFGSSCLGCMIKAFGEINDWMERQEPGDCWTGFGGNPCAGATYGYREH